jgi:hypothetical protein
MSRRRKFPHCPRRPVPRQLKIKIMLRQEGRCADCDTCLVIGSIVFDHRPPLALRDVCADPNDPNLLAAICTGCDRHKTRQDLKVIARFRRGAFTYNQYLALEQAGVLPRRLSSSTETLELRAIDGHQPRSLYETPVERAQAQWELEERGLGSWPPFSKMDLT